MQGLTGGKGSLVQEIEFSSNFEKAPIELLSRAHSSEYLSFVSSLSKQLQPDEANEMNQNDKKVIPKPNTVVPFTPQVQKTMFRQSSETIKVVGIEYTVQYLLIVSNF